MTIDSIDITVARVFDVSPDMLYTTRRHERLALARFTAWILRQDRGATLTDLAKQYSRSTNEIWHGIKRAGELFECNRDYRQKYEQCTTYLAQNRVPYDYSLLRKGAKVWTRPDSKGNQVEAVVTDIHGGEWVFFAESFEQPNLVLHGDMTTGSQWENMETSLDIVEIEP